MNKEGTGPRPSFSAKVISTSRDGQRAQVVTCVGQGSRRRSITRHTRLEDGKRVGLNPDDKALARLNNAEAGLREAQSGYDLVRPLSRLKAKEIARAISGPPGNMPKGLRGIVGEISEDQRSVANIQAVLKGKLEGVSIALREAKSRAKKAAQEIPRFVIYTS